MFSNQFACVRSLLSNNGHPSGPNDWNGHDGTTLVDNVAEIEGPSGVDDEEDNKILYYVRTYLYHVLVLASMLC